jgi:hypothetical protein
MDRRDALRLFGAAATLPAATDLLTFGRRLHERLAARPALRTFDPHQNATVTAVADRIIPATDTPGATAARVNEFADLLLAEWVPEERRTHFLAGLADLDARARAAFGKDFVDGAESDQVRLLTLLEDEAFRLKDQPGAHPEPFFRMIKWVTMYGYYTSEIGARQELHFEIVPGRYLPCTPLGAADGVPGGGGK